MPHGDNWRTNPMREQMRVMDPYAHAQTIISEEHRLIHDGMYFSANVAISGLANLANFDVLLQVPSGTFPHLRAWNYSLQDGPCNFSLFEGTTVSAAGTAMAATNNNRNSSNTANLVLTHTPTVTDAGTGLLEDHYIPDPGGGFLSGSPGVNFGDASEEWVLKQSENYLLRLTNNSGGAIDGSLYLVFYEISYEE